MLDSVKKYIAENDLLKPHDTVIVGVSGGADSMALLDILILLGYRCIAAHCNFHLRGEESDGDAAFVKKWCEDNDIEFIAVDFDTHQFAADKKISIEMAARELRYNWFEMVRQQFHADCIAVAHHKDDSIETVLLNLIRGTGIKGLTGISPKNGRVVRPLLGVTREEIEHYLRERTIGYVTDKTNNEDIYTRNFIRINILPKLQEINPSVKDAIYRTSQNLTEAEKVYQSAINEQIKNVFRDNIIDIAALKKTPSPLSVLFELLSPMGFHPSVIEDIAESLDAVSGKIFYAENLRLIKDRNSFILDAMPEKIEQSESVFIDKVTQEITLPIHLKISIEAPHQIKKSNRFLYADADKLSFPLELRKWQPGDWFIPFGMKGKKKLSDFFTDRKLNLKEKENAWVLLSGKNIVWVVGRRPDNRFRVTEHTKSVLKIELMEEQNFFA